MDLTRPVDCLVKTDLLVSGVLESGNEQGEFFANIYPFSAFESFKIMLCSFFTKFSSVCLIVY
jgi:hypothetical protein